jgi:hypothetical protein
LRTQPKHFWKYISKFKRNDQSVTQIDIGNKIITEPQLIADAFADRRSSIFNLSSSVHVPNNSDCVSSDFLNIPYISDSDVERAISRLRSMKCGGPDEIPNFIIKGCSEILTHLLRHIFNLSLLTGKFPSLWKKAAVVPFLRQTTEPLLVIDNRALAGNRPISIFSNFSKIFESIIHDNISFYFKFKLLPNQHGFIKSKYTVANLVPYLNDDLPSVCSQGQFNFVYFELGQAFDKVSHTLLLDKLNNFGLSSFYVDWFHTYLSSFVF